jgi:predicted transcriptional regulator
MSGNIFYKVPLELCKMVLRENLISEAKVWLAGHLIYSGNAKANTTTYEHLSATCGVSESTVYKKINLLEELDWLSKNKVNNWLHFRTKKHLFSIHKWESKKSAVAFIEDVPQFKAFCIGAVVSNFIKRSRSAKTGLTRRRPEQAWHPVSLSIIENLFEVSEKTAFTYRKIASQHGYLKMREDIREIQNLLPNELKHLRQQEIQSIKVKPFGSTEFLRVNTKQLKKKRNKVVLQLPNLILPNILIKKDRYE